MNKADNDSSFEKRRGKFIYSAPEGKSAPSNLHLDMSENTFNIYSEQDSVFSITVSDDSKDVFFDMKNCEVIPVGYVDRILSAGEKHKKAGESLRTLLFCSVVVSISLAAALAL